MKFTANQIAEILEGEIVGDALVEVSTLSKIEEGKEGSLTFLSNPKYTPYIYDTEASVVVVNKTFEPEKDVSATLLKVEDAYKAFTQLLEFYNQIKLSKTGIEEPSFISKSASVGENPYIGAFAYIGENVRLGNNVKIYPNSYVGDNVTIDDNSIIFSGVRIYSDTKIGKNCMINSGSVIGADGFGFVPNEEGVYKKVPQIGNVILEDNVDIGAATTIDRATLGSTIIRKGVKLDNHIQVAHNVEIDENTVIASQTGIAGSTKIGKGCQIGGQVGIVGHVTIGDNVRIQAQSGIGRSLKDGETVQGSPALGYSDYNKSYVYFKNLPKLAKQISELEKELKALKEK
ncbi:MAG: UDP-3-O-(3-hydroxymyristoyl)glucosamine N-acyltransferase [Urechidicola sp.]|nr:UDP-3-O-(3-hydroxymyristoyl)glucosamine N-acyltransferase [Urechidicola sp.]